MLKRGHAQNEVAALLELTAASHPRHVALTVLSLLLERTAEHAGQDTWRNIRDDLKRIQLAQLLSPHGTVRQVTEPTAQASKRLFKVCGPELRTGRLNGRYRNRCRLCLQTPNVIPRLTVYSPPRRAFRRRSYVIHRHSGN